MDEEIIAEKKLIIQRRMFDWFWDYINNNQIKIFQNYYIDRLKEFSRAIKKYNIELNKLNRYERLALTYCHELGYSTNLKQYYLMIEDQFEKIHEEVPMQSLAQVEKKKAQLQDTLPFFNKYQIYKDKFKNKTLQYLRQYLKISKQKPKIMPSNSNFLKIVTKSISILENLNQQVLSSNIMFWKQNQQNVGKFISMGSPSHQSNQIVEHSHDTVISSSIQQILFDEYEQVQQTQKSEFIVLKNKRTPLKKKTKKKVKNLNDSTQDTNKINQNISFNMIQIKEESFLYQDDSSILEKSINILGNSHQQIDQQSSFKSEDQQYNEQITKNVKSIPNESIKMKQIGQSVIQKKLGRNHMIKTDPILARKPIFKAYPTLKEIKEIIIRMIDIPYQECLNTKN